MVGTEIILEYEPELEHRLIFTEKSVFGVIGGKIKTASMVRAEPPAIAVRELQKVPAGYIAFSEFLFYPELFEEYTKFLHVLLLTEIPVELSVVDDTVMVTHNTVDEALRISKISIENNTLIMERSYSSNLKYETFKIRKLGEFYVVEEYRDFKLKNYRIRRLSGESKPYLQKA